MLTEEQLEYISDVLRPLFQYLEHEVIVDVANRIKETLAYTRTAEIEAQALQKLGYSPSRIRKAAMKILNEDPEFRKQVAKNTLEHKKTVKKLLRDITKEAYKGNDMLFADMGDLSYLDDLRIWRSNGKELSDDSYLHDLVKGIESQTKGELYNITGTTGFKTMAGFESIQDTYRRELDKALIKICTGAFSKEKVIYDVIHEMAHSGLRTIDYASGRHKQLDTAVKLAVRTGGHQLAEQITANNVMNSGENLIYVSRHWGARNTGTGHANHEEWQGRVYFIKPGKSYAEEAKRIGQDYITDLWYATGYSMDGAHPNDPFGLNGYNCRHKTYVFFEGISRISDIQKEEPKPEPIEIDGKKYDYYAITQKMRSMERNIRALKREREALTKLDMDTKEVKAKIKKKTAEYENFCDRVGMKAKLNRLRYDNGTSDITKTQAYKEYKRIAVGDEEGYTRFRKTDNTNIGIPHKEPMQLKHVKNVMADMGIDYGKAKIKIIRDKELVDTGYFGWTNPNMKEVQLYPDAFKSREELVKTLGHERVHMEQLKLFGPAMTNEELIYFEKGPLFSEEYWWKEYRRKTNYVQESN